MVVKVGFVGCGGIARAHVERLSRIREARVVGFFDVDFKRAEAMARSVGGRAYPDLRGMLEGLDAVYVCVPPFAHGFEPEIVERGIHLFVEKPVALAMDVARRVERAIARAGVLSSVGYMWRYLDTTALAGRVLEEGGPVGMVEGFYIDPYWFPPGHWWIDKRRGGGQVVEQSTHVFDLARHLVGDVVRVYAELDTLLLTDVPGFSVEDVSVVTLRFKGGAVGVVLSTCASRRTLHRSGLRVFAKSVALEHGGHSGVLRIYRDEGVEEVRPAVDPYLEEDRAFINAVATGDGSAIRSPYSDAVKTLEVTLAANEASREGRIVILGGAA